jgi:putative transposase
MDAQHTKHVTYKLGSHFVWCPKYRKRLLTGKMAVFVEEEIRRLCEANEWTLGSLNMQEDQVPLFLSAPPAVAPSQIAHPLKGATAHQVFQHFPAVKKQLWGGAFWSRSYAHRNPETNMCSVGEDDLYALEDIFGQFVSSLCAALFPKRVQEQDTEPLPMTVWQKV